MLCDILFTSSFTDISKSASAGEREKKKKLNFFFCCFKQICLVAGISVHHYYTLLLKGKEKNVQSVFVFKNESQTGLKWHERVNDDRTLTNAQIRITIQREQQVFTGLQVSWTQSEFNISNNRTVLAPHPAQQLQWRSATHWSSRRNGAHTGPADLQREPAPQRDRRSIAAPTLTDTRTQRSRFTHILTVSPARPQLKSTHFSIPQLLTRSDPRQLAGLSADIWWERF